MRDIDIPHHMTELCRCGIARWYHEAGRRAMCPEHAGRMDWRHPSEFMPSGKFATPEEVWRQAEEQKPNELEPSDQTTHRKIFVFVNSRSKEFVCPIAVCECGEAIAIHACSSDVFIAHDMGLVGDWKHKEYDAHCGPGQWELEFVEDEKVRSHPELGPLIHRRNI